MADCLTDEILLRFVERQSAAEEVAAVEAHIDGCDGCRALLAAAALALGCTGAPAASTAPGEGGADDPAPADAPPARIDEYRVIRPLGRGAMGQVLLAQDTLLERPVAIKLIVAARPDPAARERFLTEARAIARLQHPNVVAIYRVGTWQDQPYLVSEYVRGKSLDWLPLPAPEEQVVCIGAALARGLFAAHRRGVLHRDIKPANAILSDDGEAKLLDFGLAKLVASFAPEAGAPPPDLDGPGHGSLTRTGALLGTPRYLAPECWRGEAATRRSDLYSLGALLFELRAGRPPHQGRTLAELASAVGGRDAPPLAEAAPGTDGRLCALVDRCLRRDPAERPDTADEVVRRLEELAHQRGEGPEAPLPPGNPYRGLSTFEGEHGALFFGRDAEVRAVVDLLREEPLVLVCGDSGVGKSSLCRAGVAPRVVAGALGGGRRWRALALVPGRHPLRELCGLLAPALGQPAAAIEAAARAEPGALLRLLSQRLDAPGAGEGLLLLLDQLEELLTQSEPAEAALFGEALGHLAIRVEGLRVLCTVRGDFLARLSALPGVSGGALRGLFLLRPLAPADLREAIVGPARRKGVAFETPALVEELVTSTVAAEGGLPLLQFALAELWEERDARRAVIPAAALARIGGVAGALARHADAVVAALPPAQRAAARRILVELTTLEGTRARRSEAELAPGADAQAALRALLRGRLLFARDAGGEAAYEVAHEALLSGWPALRGWLDAERERRAARRRLGAAHGEWLRLGRPAELLLGGRLLREIAAAGLEPAHLAPDEGAFLAASRRAARRGRLLRAVAAMSLPLGLLGIYGGFALRARRELSRTIAGHVARADAIVAEARGRAEAARRGREAAFARFSAAALRDRDPEEGERLFAAALVPEREAAARYRQAERILETALLLDPARPAVRAGFADVLYEASRLREGPRRPVAEEELAERIAAYDPDGAALRRLREPALLTIETQPPGARAALQRYEEREGRRLPGPSQALGATPLAARPVPAGSYLLTLELPGRPPVRYPVLLGSGEGHRATITLPERFPDGMVYVPPGRFLFGSSEDAMLRSLYPRVQPLHPVTTGAYLIGRTEVTFADWLRYLDELPPGERARRTQRLRRLNERVELRQVAGGWELTIQPRTRAYTLGPGERLVYPGRRTRAGHDWTRLPVTGVTFDDAQAYGAWLDRTGRLPGARLCTEHEWERAARGADDRTFPHGDRLAPDDANHDATYGRQPLAFGPDEVGSHPASDSPFGVADMAGNAWEWVVSDVAPGEIVSRGGGYYEGALSSRSDSREQGEPSQRDVETGFRVCAAWPPRADARR